MNSAIFLTILLIMTGCTLFYFASKNQQGLKQPLLRKPALAAGYLLLLSSIILLWINMQGAAAVFTFTILVMASFTVLPYLGAFIGFKRRLHYES